MNLKSDTMLYGAASLMERALGLLLLPLLTRALSEAEYGVWAQTAVVSSLVMPLVLFGLPAGIVRRFAASQVCADRRRWMLRLPLLAAAWLGLLALLALVLRDTVALAAYGDTGRRAFVAVLLLVVAGDALFELLVAFLRADFRMPPIAALLIGRGVLRLAVMAWGLNAAGLGFQRSFALLALLQLAVVTLAHVLALARLRRQAAKGGTPAAAGVEAAGQTVRLRELLAFSAPLALVALLGSLHAFADRFVLTHLLGLAPLAVYAAAATLVGLTGLAYTVLGFTLFPVLSRLWSQGETERAAALAGQAVRVFLFLALPYVLWLACAAEVLLPLLTTEAYRLPAQVLLLLGVAAVALGLYQTLLYMLLLAGRGLRAAGAMGAAALLNTALNLLLVPRHGLLGAAVAAAASNAALATAAYLLVQGPLELRFPWGSAMRIAASAAIAALPLLGVLQLPGLEGGVGLLLGLTLSTAAYLAADWLIRPSMLRGIVMHEGVA